MKAAVLHQFGQTPRYEDFPDPVLGEGELQVKVKAVALENIDHALAAGTHYANRQMLPSLPAILGFDGIGSLEDGRLVGFYVSKSPYGAMAEFAVVQAAHIVPVPEDIDALILASAPSSTLSSMLPFRSVARLQPGETVLINGATGFAGKIAVQVAKQLGAGRVIGTGRNVESLTALADLGADAVIDLNQSDKELADSFKQAAGDGYDVIVDFLWGRPTEVLIQTLVPTELRFTPRHTRLVQIGAAAGLALNLPAEAMRTSGLEIYGAGSISPNDMADATVQMWGWLKAGALRFDIEAVPLAAIESAWTRTELRGKRLVIVP